MPEDLKQTVMEAPGGLWLYKISDWSGDSIRFEESQRELHSCPSTKHAGEKMVNDEFVAGLGSYWLFQKMKEAALVQRYLKFETSETWGVELTLAQSEAFAESILAKVNEIRQHG